MFEAKTAGFRLLPSYYEVIRELPDDERLRLYDAVMDYGFGNEPQELPAMLRGYLKLMIPSIEKSIRFEEKQKANGSKGGRPRKPKENPDETQKNPNETQNDFGENLAIAIDVDVANDIEKEKKRTKKKFVPPTLEEVEAYCRERGNNVNAKKFYDGYSVAGWKDSEGKPVLNWKQKIIQVWERDGKKSSSEQRSETPVKYYHAEDDSDAI